MCPFYFFSFLFMTFTFVNVFFPSSCNFQLTTTLIYFILCTLSTHNVHIVVFTINQNNVYMYRNIKIVFTYLMAKLLNSFSVNYLGKA